jgi:hypothetical protein
MAKDINITHIDNAKTNEQIGERKKVPLAHEKLFKEFNIDPKKVFDGTVLKQVPHSWVPEIIQKNIKSCKSIEIVEAQHIENSKAFILIFKDFLDANKFDSTFAVNMFRNINDYIISKNEKPEMYHRNIIFTKSIEDNKITIQY